jgi:hypothetical protein
LAAFQAGAKAGVRPDPERAPIERRRPLRIRGRRVTFALVVRLDGAGEDGTDRGFPAFLLFFLLVAALVRGTSSCAAARPAVDLGTYAADSFACIETEPTDACHADREACKARMDRCIKAVRDRYADAGGL